MTGTDSQPPPPAPPAYLALQTTPVNEWAAGLAQRRRRALDEVADELGPAHQRTDQPGVALRDYAPGCVCLGIAGPVERATAERLQSLLAELRGRGRHELVISLAALGPWHPQLARVLAHARICHLVGGAHVEFHDLPEALAAELGPGLPTTFLVVDTTDAEPPAPPRRRSAVERRAHHQDVPHPGTRPGDDGVRPTTTSDGRAAGPGR
jgi:hypothetical protein